MFLESFLVFLVLIFKANLKRMGVKQTGIERFLFVEKWLSANCACLDEDDLIGFTSTFISELFG